MDSLKSFDIQLTDIWIECQKEMIEMRNKIMNLSDCLKTSELINRHLSKCNETLVAIVEKCSLNDHKNNVIIGLIDVIREEEECIEREKQNLRTFGDNLNNNKVNDKRVFELIKVWNQCKPKRALTKDKGIQAIDVHSLTQIQSLDQISDKRSVDCIEECNERPKRHRKAISYKDLNEGIDIMDKEVESTEREDKSEINQIFNEFDSNNSLIITKCDSIDTKNDSNDSDQDFDCVSEGMADSDNEYSLEESFEKKSKKIDDKSRRTRRMDSNYKPNENIKILKVNTKGISERIANNECVTEVDESDDLINIIYLKSEDSTETESERTRIGFGCSWIGCEFVNITKWKVIRHIDAVHKNRKPFKCNECEFRSARKLNIKYHKNFKHNKDLVYYECDVNGCGFRTRFLPLFQRHKQRQKCLKNKTTDKTSEESKDSNKTKNRVGIRSKSTDRLRIKTLESDSNYSQKEKIKVLKLITKEISERVANNECETHIDDNDELINIIYLKTDDSTETDREMTRIGFGCTWIGCNFVNNTKSKVYRHIDDVHKTKQFKCNECEFTTARERTLKYHNNLKHNTNDVYYECDANGCGYRTKTLSLFQTHKRSKSHIFNKKTLTVSELQKLIDSNQTIQRTDESNELIRIYHHKSDDNIKSNYILGYGCNWNGCQYIIFKRQRIVEHIEGIHLNLKRFVCDQCEYKTTNKRYLNSHLMDVHKINRTDSNLLCCDWKDCNYETTETTKLKKHKNRHLGHKAHKCHWPSCEFESHSKTSLNVHIRVHNNERPFQCEWPGCEMRFRANKYLRNHLLVHTNERNITCNWPGCEARFKTHTARCLHQVIHTGIKRFACTWPECKSTFRDGSGLRQHLMIHNDEKPIICLDKECDQRFRVKTQMTKHFRTKHKNKLHLLDN